MVISLQKLIESSLDLMMIDVIDVIDAINAIDVIVVIAVIDADAHDSLDASVSHVLLTVRGQQLRSL